jgi:hypothetical protein
VSLAIARRALKTCVVVLFSSIAHVQILVLHGLRPVPDQFSHTTKPRDVLLLDVICRRRGIKWLSIVPVRWFFRVFGDCTKSDSARSPAETAYFGLCGSATWTRHARSRNFSYDSLFPTVDTTCAK